MSIYDLNAYEVIQKKRDSSYDKYLGRLLLEPQ